MQTALALSCGVQAASRFERKHYFYADLPAGFQITQQAQPIALAGLRTYPVVDSRTQKLAYKQARIRRVQLEHDSARSLRTDDLALELPTETTGGGEAHTLPHHSTLIDLNRAGMGLMEIVTEPDFESAFDAYSFVRELAFILRSLGTCKADMSEGSFRVDGNFFLIIFKVFELVTRYFWKSILHHEPRKKAWKTLNDTKFYQDQTVSFRFSGPKTSWERDKSAQLRQTFFISTNRKKEIKQQSEKIIYCTFLHYLLHFICCRFHLWLVYSNELNLTQNAFCRLNYKRILFFKTFLFFIRALKLFPF